MAECFCGCGRSVPLRPRQRAWNTGGKLLEDRLDKLRAARNRPLDDAERVQLEDAITTGELCVDTFRQLLHGEAARDDVEDELKAAGKRFNDISGSMLAVGGIAGPDLDLTGSRFGLHADDVTELWDAGAHAPGTVTEVRFTGQSVNQRPRVAVTIRVQPPGEPAFDVGEALLVSPVDPPRRGEPVDVAYDPADHTRFTFRKSDLTDGEAPAPAPGPAAAAAADPVQQLDRLADLHGRGVLTDAEFEAQKAKILDRM